MSASKKRKYSDEKRAFKVKWEEEYFFIESEGKPLCLLCLQTVAVFKEFNIRRHYEAFHKSQYSQYVGKSRSDILMNLKIKHLYQKSMLCESEKFENPTINNVDPFIKTYGPIMNVLVEKQKDLSKNRELEFSVKEEDMWLEIKEEDIEERENQEMASCDQNLAKLQVAVLTVSDRCFHGKTTDASGYELKSLINSCNLFEAEVVAQSCSPDIKEIIQHSLIEWCDYRKVDLVLTTGGTGIAPRDVTPEAVKEIIERDVPGISLEMMSESLKITPLAMLSRPVCGIRKNTLIITLPGSVKGSQECLRFVSPAIVHAIDLIKDQKTKVEGTHSLLQKKGIQTPRKGVANGTPKQAKGEEEVKSKACVTKVARRDRKSPYQLISVGGAQEKLFSLAFSTAVKRVKVTESLGYAVAEDVYAKEPLPPFPASVKDGYAVVVADGCGPREVMGQSCAGVEPRLSKVSPGTCMRINTGAPVPPGADAVVQVEDTKVLRESDDGTEEHEIEILKSPTDGQDIRPKGCDISVGELLLTKGQFIGPAEIGIMASAGILEAQVHNKPVTAILSTGNELQSPSKTPLEKGRIYDSNKVTLLSLLEQYSFPAIDAGIAKDDPSELLRALRCGLSKADILVTSGGVSMGEKDLLRPVLTTDLEATIHFAQVFMKPGKPTTFATCTFDGKPKLILGLPGNPVSTIVTAHLYLLPVCRKMSGQSDYQNTVIKAKLGSEFVLDPRPEYHRATLSWSSGDDLPTAFSTGKQMSSRLLSMASAQALLLLPPKAKENTSLPAGSVVEAIVLNL